MPKAKRGRPQRDRYEVVFALPTLLPLPDDYSLTHTAGEGGPIVTVLRFRWAEAVDSRSYGAVTAVARETWETPVTDIRPHGTFRDRITVVVASTIARPVWDDEPHEELADPYFARVVRQVDNLLQAYGLLSSQAVPGLGPTTIFPIMVQRWVLTDGSTTSPAVVALDTAKTARKRVERLLPLPLAKINELALIAGRLDRVRSGRPYYTSVRLFSNAERSLNAREPEAAVVEAASAVESMGWEMLRSMAEEDSIHAPPPKTAFRNVLADHLLRRLGASVSDTAVAAWLSQGYEFRHMVVHEGAQSSMANGIAAVRSAGELSERLDDALIVAVAKYPRTAARKLGSALLKRVAADAALARIVEAETTSPLEVGVVQQE